MSDLESKLRQHQPQQHEQQQQQTNNLISSATYTASTAAIPSNTSSQFIINHLHQQQSHQQQVTPNQIFFLKNNHRTIAVDSLNNINKNSNQKHFKYVNPQDYEEIMSPVSKTPDSDSYLTNDLSNQLKISRFIKSAGSMGTLGDSDHDLFESSATGLSGSGSNGLEGDESVDEDYDSNSMSINGNLLDEQSDYTTKRLKTFVATTLHNEIVYLSKLSILLKFKNYLEEHFKEGSQADLSVLFSSISQIYTTHDIVASKLQEYLQTLNDLINNSFTLNTTKINSNLSTVSTVCNSSKSTTFGITSTNNSCTPKKFAPTSFQSNSNTAILAMKETFLASALQLLANIMEISFPVYLEFLKNYSKSMTILNKLENSKLSQSFSECQTDFNKSLQNFFKRNQKTQQLINKDPYNIYYNDKPEEEFDITKMFTEDILRRPTKLFEFIYSLKDECMLACKELPNQSSLTLQANIKSLFDNTESKKLQEKVFYEINRNIMPKVIRKNEDVVELVENSNDKKLRHLILYGDCLVCCKFKKEKGHLKWFIPIDRLETFLDEFKSSRSEKEIRHLREEVLSLRGDLKRQSEGGHASTRNQQKIKKKLVEQENELAIKSSRLKLIVRSNPSLAFVSPSNYSSTQSNNSSSTPSGLFLSNSTFTAFSNSMTNLNNLNHKYVNQHSNSLGHHLSPSHHHQHQQQHNASPSISSNSNNTVNNATQNFIILFTSDFERNAWLEEINGAMHGFKARKTTIQLSQSDIEARINSLKKSEEAPKATITSCTGSLELLIKHIDELAQPNKVFVAVELKSCGSYLQVAQTNCSELTKNPIWNEKFNLELQCVDSLRIILYSQTSSKPLALSSQELKIDSEVNLNKITAVKLNNGVTIHLSFKFLSPKKTITRRRTRNRNDIFGGNLTDLLQREKSTIPRILKDCVEVIETKGIEEVGIYRVSSVVSEVHRMKELYSKNPNQTLNELRQKSPHLSANLLKLYLRELPDPLFTSHLYDRFMSALECSIPDFRLVELCRIFNELPEPNKTIILFVLTHLLNIASHSDKNMMGLQNLCTLFGPTLMKLSPKDNLQVDDMSKEIKESMQQAQVLFYILQLHSDDKLIADLPDKTKYTDNNTKNLLSEKLSKLHMNKDKNNNHLAKLSNMSISSTSPFPMTRASTVLRTTITSSPSSTLTPTYEPSTTLKKNLNTAL